MGPTFHFDAQEVNFGQISHGKKKANATHLPEILVVCHF